MNNTFSLGHILLGTILALGIPLLTEPLQTQQMSVKRPLKLIRYILVLKWDIVVANLAVAKLILGPTKSLQPGFVAYPLNLTGDLPITLLASTISLTPGTLSAEVSKDKKWLYIHALDLPSEQALIDEIKQRYETPLKEIFQC
jgi:multicomponent K+:H+ antiporter subunit E